MQEFLESSDCWAFWSSSHQKSMKEGIHAESHCQRTFECPHVPSCTMSVLTGRKKESSGMLEARDYAESIGDADRYESLVRTKESRALHHTSRHFFAMCPDATTA
jgi:hypothetical protein